MKRIENMTYLPFFNRPFVYVRSLGGIVNVGYSTKKTVDDMVRDIQCQHARNIVDGMQTTHLFVYDHARPKYVANKVNKDIKIQYCDTIDVVKNEIVRHGGLFLYQCRIRRNRVFEIDEYPW